MIPGKQYTIDDYLQILWRRKWLLILPTLLAIAGAVAYGRTLPNLYRSQTLIMIQPQQVRADIVRTTVTQRLSDRVQTISQQIMTRTRLEAIVTDLNLYERERRVGLMEDVVDRMRRDVDVRVVRGDTFRVAYTSTSPLTAMRVAERLATLFIDESLRDREALAQGTTQFLTSQLEDARRRLMEQEKRLEEYRRRHAGELPSQQQSNLSAFNNAQMQAQSLADSIARDRDRLQLLDRMIADLTSPEAADAMAPPAGAAASVTTAAQQLQAARATLAQLELRLKPEHPDVLRQRRTVRDLEQKAEEEALASPLSPDAGRPRTPAEIARFNRIRQLQEESEGLKKAIVKKDADLERLRERAMTYQARAEAAPTRETELIELMRDYDAVQRLYANLLAKNEESKLAVNLEARQIGEQFRIIDSARIPQRPFSPNRSRLNLIGIVVGLGLGLGGIVLLEWRDTALKTEGDVKMALGMPVLALVPLMRTNAEERRARQIRWLVAGASAAGVVMAAALAAYFVLRT